eukprot:9119546-Pyramimonas_sp.AAC.1
MAGAPRADDPLQLVDLHPNQLLHSLPPAQSRRQSHSHTGSRTVTQTYSRTVARSSHGWV